MSEENLENKEDMINKILVDQLKDLLFSGETKKDEINKEININLGYKALFHLFNYIVDQPDFDEQIQLDLNDIAAMESLSRKFRNKSRKLKRSMNPKPKRTYKFDHCALNQESIDTVLSVINENNGRIFKLIQWNQAGIDLVGFFYY